MDTKNEHTIQSPQFPPVVSVLGHVDHGKTTLLDAIRKTTIATRETGGITQKIGASSIEILHEGKKRNITFIDTPGHEAFANMRSQGVTASDIVLLIVASDDGVKPQTKESIQKIQEAKVPYIVVFTKSDAPGAILEKVKQHVLREGILLEGLGGEVPYIAVSAKTGDKIQDLLDLIVLVYDMANIKKNEKDEFSGVVIEAKLDQRRGNVASVVVKSGTLSTTQKLYKEQKEVGKVRALFDTLAKSVKQALPGDAVEVLGLTEILSAGSVLSTKPHTRQAELIPTQDSTRTMPLDLAAFFAKEKNDTLAIILKTETSGELEAIKASLPEKVKIVSEGQGEIGVADVLLAKDFHALILGFNVVITREAKTIADTDRVFYKTYKIIYELLDEVGEARELLGQEQLPIGRAEIIASFSGTEGKILGVKVLDGDFKVGDKVSLMKGESELGKSRILSIKRGKEDVKMVKKGIECGLTLTPALDFTVGDMLLSHSKSSI